MFFEIFVALGHVGYLCPAMYCTSIVGFTSTNALEVLTSLRLFFPHHCRYVGCWDGKPTRANPNI